MGKVLTMLDVEKERKTRTKPKKQKLLGSLKEHKEWIAHRDKKENKDIAELTGQQPPASN